MKILYQRHMLNRSSHQHKTQLLAEVLHRARTPGGASDEDDNGTSASDSTHDTATHAAAEVHMQEETEHDTEVVSQDDGEEKTNAEFAY